MNALQNVQPESCDTPADPPVAIRKARTGTREGVLQFLSHGKALTGAVILAVMIIVAVLAPVIAPGDPAAPADRQNLPPSTEFLLGTNGQQQDVFRQIVWGARTSLLIGFSVGALITVIGLVVGMIGGYMHGAVDGVFNVFTNVFLIIPALPLLIILASFLKPGVGSVILVLTISSWAWSARVFRSQTLCLCEKDFVSAALVSGEPMWRIVFVEILPNMLSLAVSTFFGNVVYAIGADVGLAFLGFENTNTVSWGTMLYWARQNSALMTGAWWTFVPPGICVALVAFATTLMIYAVDEITNPRLRSEKEITRVLKQHRIASQQATPVVRRTSV